MWATSTNVYSHANIMCRPYHKSTAYWKVHVAHTVIFVACYCYMPITDIAVNMRIPCISVQYGQGLFSVGQALKLTCLRVILWSFVHKCSMGTDQIYRASQMTGAEWNWMVCVASGVWLCGIRLTFDSDVSLARGFSSFAPGQWS